MAARLQLTQDVYMFLDGQWQIVLSGSIIDVPTASMLSPQHAQTYVGTPNPVSHPSSVSNVRTK